MHPWAGQTVLEDLVAEVPGMDSRQASGKYEEVVEWEVLLGRDPFVEMGLPWELLC